MERICLAARIAKADFRSRTTVIPSDTKPLARTFGYPRNFSVKQAPIPPYGAALFEIGLAYAVMATPAVPYGAFSTIAVANMVFYALETLNKSQQF
jgi:hypothetical protein